MGTFVEITASGRDRATLEGAVQEAFEAIERVQRLMSVHDETSELSRVNSGALEKPVQVSTETFDVLRRGLDLAECSHGAFDFTVAPLLARWGLLPSALRRRAAGDWRDVRLLPGQHVQFNRPLAIDLGGIAKGYAVDAAVTALHRRSVNTAIVNAGGDLRGLGSEDSLVHLRHPSSARPLSDPITIRDEALATSSPCFTRRRWRGVMISHLVNPTRGRAITNPVSVSVRAPECWLADALTKVVLNAPDEAAEILRRYDAEAFVLIA